MNPSAEISKNPNWSKEEDDLLVRNFDLVDTLEELVSLFTNRNYNAIKARSTFLKLRIRPVYSKNEEFFAIPNTLNSSIAGIIASDGHIRPSRRRSEGYTICFNLSSKDRCLLEKISSECGSNYKITDSSKKFNIKCYRGSNKVRSGISHQSYLGFYNARKWSEDLYRNWNIHEGDKSLTLEPPINLNINNSLSYICGLITGDGTIGIHRNGRYKQFRIGMLGTKNLLLWAKNVIQNAFQIKIKSSVRKERDGANIYSFYMGRSASIILINYINQLDCVSLDRKWRKPEVLAYVARQKEKYPHLFNLKPCNSV